MIAKPRGCAALFVMAVLYGCAPSEPDRRFGVDIIAGVLVRQIEPGSIAALAEIQPGDLLFHCGGVRTYTLGDFSSCRAGLKGGEAIEFEVLRRGSFVTLRARTPRDLGPDGMILGLTPESGVYVGAVFSGSVAANAGIHVGDFLTEFGEHQIESFPRLREFVRNAPPGSQHRILLIRDGQDLSRAATIP